MKKKNFNEISGTMSKAEMKKVMGGDIQYCGTNCTVNGRTLPCFRDLNQPQYGCICAIGSNPYGLC